ncbi:DUF3417 domain-containing protein [Sesbania bispinosa]|nr:DUF3417 domain-containing protein [Sesbania bispinosa]
MDKAVWNSKTTLKKRLMDIIIREFPDSCVRKPPLLPLQNPSTTSFSSSSTFASLT